MRPHHTGLIDKQRAEQHQFRPRVGSGCLSGTQPERAHHFGRKSHAVVASLYEANVYLADSGGIGLAFANGIDSHPNQSHRDRHGQDRRNHRADVTSRTQGLFDSARHSPDSATDSETLVTPDTPGVLWRRLLHAELVKLAAWRQAPRECIGPPAGTNQTGHHQNGGPKTASP